MSIGIIVGRFQVASLHDGHKALIKLACKENENVLIFLGISPVMNTKNPLDYPTRNQMIWDFLNDPEESGDLSKVDVTTLPISDMPSNQEWSKNLDEKIREVLPFGDVKLYGGFDSFLGSYSGKHSSTIVENVSGLHGSDSRKKTATICLPSEDFRSGVIYSQLNQWPKVVPTVDVTVHDVSRGLVLMAKKTTDKGFRFIGGHVDLSDDSLESAAIRELREEAGGNLEFKRPLDYIGSFKVADWRHDKTGKTGIMTTFFVTEYAFGFAEAHDDIASVHWVEPSMKDIYKIEDAHKPLFEALCDKIANEKK